MEKCSTTTATTTPGAEEETAAEIPDIGISTNGGEDAPESGDGRYVAEEEYAEEEEEESEIWYLMAGTWLSRWHDYVLSGAGQDLDFPTPVPGPITNGDLVDTNDKPFPGKVAGKNYR